MVSGCDRELNAHFYSAATLKYDSPDTWSWYHTQSHYLDTGSTSPSSTPLKVWMPSEQQLVPFLMTLVCRGQGSDLLFPRVDTLPTELLGQVKWNLSWCKTKPTIQHKCPEKTETSLSIRAVWSESSLSARNLEKSLPYQCTSKTDQTGQVILLVLSCFGSCYYNEDGKMKLEQVAQRATIVHLSPICQVNLPQNLMQSFPHPNDATHKIWSRLTNWLPRYSSSKVWNFRHSKMSGLIWPKIELDRAFMLVLVSSNFDDDLIKNGQAGMETPFSHYKSMGNFLDAQEQLTP